MAIWSDSRIIDLLGIELPIIQAPEPSRVPPLLAFVLLFCL